MDFKNLVVTSWQNTVNHIGPILLVTFVQMLLIIFTVGILAPVTTAGYVQSLLQVVRQGRPPEIRDLFSQMRLFFPLFLFFLLFTVVAIIGFTMLFLPGFLVIGFVAFAAFYLIPLMTDKKLGLFEALKESWDMAMEKPVSDHIIVAIIYVAIMSLGSSLPFAFLITQPLATFILVGAYQEKIALIETKQGDEQPIPEETAKTVPPIPEDSANQDR
jgi:phosphoglycerol transferase MdoB-like AlkP superfamily enzyme